MFTDNPVTPMHLESLLSFVRVHSKKNLTRDIIKGAFQPPSLTDNQTQSNTAIRAAISLGLLIESDDKTIIPTKALSGKESIDECLKKALDEKVLCSLDVEKYLSLFYGFVLGLNQNVFEKTKDDWVINFNRDVCKFVFIDNEEDENRFNSTKLSGLHRWFSYMGLGWYDQKDEFNCNPFERISRSLSKVFGRESKLECNDFMTALSRVCPELDGGEIFLQANQRYDRDAKQCTLGLSHALIELHSTKQLVLYCPKDSDGWSIASAGPTNDGKTLVGDRISHVELGKGFQHAK